MTLTKTDQLSVTQRGLLILSAGRFAGLLLVLLFLLELENIDVRSRSNSILFISLTALFTLGQLILNLKRTVGLAKLGFIQLAIDVVLISFLTTVTSSSYPFVMYVILIGCAALLLGSEYSIILAAFSGICYGFVITFDQTTLITELDVFLAYVSLVSAALLSTFYAKQVEGLKISITEKEKELKRVTLDQMHLIDSFSEGIITLDLNSAITGINQAAKILLGFSSIDDELCLGKLIDQALEESKVLNKEGIKALKEGEVADISSKIDDVTTTLRCSMQSIKDDDGQFRGKVLLISDIGEFKNIEERLETHERMARLVGVFNPSSLESKTIPGIIGESPLLKELLLVVEQAAPSDAPVLILGESGTGKELIAKAVHQLSFRKNKPFIAVNCGAIPENLIESELFGYKKGAFTGAEKDTLGLFREADNGTLFLDEIGELPLHMQAKLLRAIQEGVVRPVGASKEIPINVRLIAATNRSLKELVKSNSFREDLFYRLRVIELVVPPLRLRKEDIPTLVYYFLAESGIDVTTLKISPEAWELLLSYDYPGNIRELENVIHRARVLGGGSILPEHFPEDLRFFKGNKKLELTAPLEQSSESLPVNLEDRLMKLEKYYLTAALEQTRGSKKEAAKLLGLNFRSFRYRLKKYELSDDDSHDPPTLQQ